ncbi:MAG: hypothetical protein KBI39_00880 [Firmicutes bacterium]|nr:hypothetical protein [Candidatus Fermentithermobacillaceae bacterium]HON87598.1 hypothetical protein [Bacillota bacterium]HOV66313.1 hypothetical protein [Bacillota bacterium]HRC53752.1 hypothetical protein [Bacillota bacterium]
MKRVLPVFIAGLSGFLMVADFLFENAWLQGFSKDVQDWTVVVSAFALGLGAVSLIRLHGRKILRREKGWFNSIVLIVGMLFMTVRGILNGVNDGYYLFLFDNMLTPLGAAVYASLAFYIASAAYRAFRARSVEATVLLIAGLIVLLGRAPIGDSISAALPQVASWIINVPNVAAQRGIIICSAIGVMSTSLRVMLGLERRYLGN